MRENCTSGLMRGSNGNGDSRPLLSTLLVNGNPRNPRNPRFLLLCPFYLLSAISKISEICVQFS